jgi:hypothetical protein
MAMCMFVVAWAAPVHAQPPGGCSSADQARYTNYSERAVNALLKEQDVETFIGLMHEMDSGLSGSCRAALEREQPARVRCTHEERKLLLQHQYAIIVAALQGNALKIWSLLEHLEASVSSACWLAINRPDDRRVQQRCSDNELGIIASYAGPLNRATERVLRRYQQTGNLDLSDFINIAQQRQAQLSQACNNALSQTGPGPNEPSTPPKLGNIIDHGGGTLSAPGIGACTPSGCMAY